MQREREREREREIEVKRQRESEIDRETERDEERERESERHNAVRCEPGQHTVQTAWVCIFCCVILHVVFVTSLSHFPFTCSFPTSFTMGIYILLCYPLLLFNVFMILEAFVSFFSCVSRG